MNRNAERMNPKPMTEKLPTDGEQYVRDFLTETKDHAERNWLAESVDSGSILVCPRCRFLHLPFLMFPDPGLEKRGAAPVDDCDVCASIPDACGLPPGEMRATDDFEDALESAFYDVQSERRMRAELLYRLFQSSQTAADALLTAELARARHDLARLARTPLAEMR